MSELRKPIGDVLDIPVEERDVQRAWANVRRRRQRTFDWRMPALAIAAAAAVLLAFSLSASDRRVAEESVTEPLTLADGTAFGDIAEGTTRFADGSRVALMPGATMSALESSARTVALLLSEGGTNVYVEPGGPRRWSIECGLFTVEVVGTEFTIDRTLATDDDPETIRVGVQRGTVIVRGDRVPNTVQRLEAGDEIVVTGPAKSAAEELDVLLDDLEAEAEPDHQRQAALPERSTRARWRELAGRGEWPEAWSALGPTGFERVVSRGSIDELLELADVARLSGHPREAVEPLQRVITEHGDDARASLAAFTLGRVRLSNLGDARAAAADFERALAMALPAELQAAATARLAEAYARAGDDDAAAEAARRYLSQWPDGPHRAAAISLLDAPAPGEPPAP